MNHRFLLLIALIPACRTKPVDVDVSTPQPDLIAEICAIEQRRHGSEPERGKVDYFGNEAIDAYVAQPGPMEELERTILGSVGVCRDVLLQTYLKAHGSSVLERWPEMRKLMNEDDKMAVLRGIRLLALQGYDTIIFDLLEQEPSATLREDATFAVNQLDFAQNDERLIEVVRNEPLAKVRQSLLFNLSLSDQPEMAEKLRDLYDHPGEEVHRAVMLSWTTADFAGKKDAYGEYLKHENQTIRDLAKSHLATLGERDAMSLTLSGAPIATQAVRDELSPELKEALTMRSGHLLFYQLSLSPDWEVRDEKRQTPLIYAVRQPHEPLFIQLLDQKPPLNWRDEDGRTALIHAVIFGYRNYAEILLAEGADASIADHQGNTALDYAQLMEQQRTIKALEAAFQNPTAATLHPVLQAALTGDVHEISQTTSDAWRARDSNGRTPLMLAAMSGHLEAVSLLVERGADLFARDDQGLRASTLATIEERDEVAQFLKDAEAAEQRRRKFHVAVYSGDLVTVDQFLSEGGDPNTPDHSGEAPLFNTLHGCHAEVIQKLMAAGADPNRANRFGNNLRAILKASCGSEAAALLSGSRQDAETSSR